MSRWRQRSGAVARLAAPGRSSVLLLAAALLTGVGGLGAFLVGAPTAAEAVGPVAWSGNGTWRLDWSDSFEAGTLDTSVWGRYQGWPASPSKSSWDPDQVFVRDGVLVLRTERTKDGWVSGGVSASRGFAASQGKWAIRMRFPDQVPGVGYAMLLYPAGGGWPPEVDFAEGSVNSPGTMGALHFDDDNKQMVRFLDGIDWSQWHTIGAIMDGDQLTFTVDGEPWTSVESRGVPDQNMWMGLQTTAIPCDSDPGNCAGSHTPDVTDVEVDWVAHYAKT